MRAMSAAERPWSKSKTARVRRKRRASRVSASGRRRRRRCQGVRLSRLMGFSSIDEAAHEQTACHINSAALLSFLRQLALPRSVQTWSLTTLCEKLIKIGAKVVHHARSVTFQLAEVAVPRAWFAAILARIGRLRAAPGPG